MTRLVSIIGTDGSGKTTLSDALVEELQASGFEAHRVWLGAESQLMRPVRSVLRVLWAVRRPGRSTPEGRSQSVDPAGYSAEISRKNALASRFSFATRAYLWVALGDYRLQLRTKLRRQRRNELIVADRYVFDVCVNIGLTLGWDEERVIGLARRLLARVPLPQVRVFLRVAPEVSLRRKDDIPDVDYLKLRLRYYDALAGAFGFTVRDGTLPIDENVAWVMSHIERELAKPYIHYVHANNLEVGGADKVLALMASHAQQPSVAGTPGHRVSVSLRVPSSAVSAYHRCGIPVIEHPFDRPQVSGSTRTIAGSIAKLPVTAWRFHRLLAQENPDVVHVNDLYDFVPAAMARLRGIPVVYHIRMIRQNPGLRRLFSHAIPLVSDVSISVSEAVRRHYFPVDIRHRAEVVHDLGNASLVDSVVSTSATPTRPAPLPPTGRLVVMVGRVEPWKGQQVFVEAVQRLDPELRSQHVFALVGGSVPGKESYFHNIAEAAEGAGICMLGERHDVPEILRSADVAVHCSTEPDPFPGVVIEGLLAGAAVVASASGGVLEMVTSPEIGILTRPGDPTELAEALENLLTSPEPPREVYGPHGRAQALRLVDETEIDARLLAIYRELAPQSRSRLRDTTPGSERSC